MPKRHTPELRTCISCREKKLPKFFDRLEDKPGYRRSCKSCVQHDNLWTGKKRVEYKAKQIKKFGTLHIPSFRCKTMEDLEVKTSLYAIRNNIRFSERQWERFLKAVEERNAFPV